MEMRSVDCVVTFLGVLFVLGLGSCSEESRTPEEEGERLLRSLPHVSVADADTAYFEAFLGGKVCGVAELSLTPVMDGGRLLYDHRHLITLRLTKASVFLGSLRAVVDPSFTPIEITDERMTVGLRGPMDRTWISMAIGPERIDVREMQKGEETSRQIERPGGPFVTCAACILRLAEPREGSTFSLPLFRIPEGTVTRILCTQKTEPSGPTQVDLLDEEGEPAGYYRFGANRRLEAFREVGVRWVMKRSTKENVQAFQESWQKALGAVAQPDSGAVSTYE
jgi:hypothetical protein